MTFNAFTRPDTAVSGSPPAFADKLLDPLRHVDREVVLAMGATFERDLPHGVPPLWRQPTLMTVDAAANEPEMVAAPDAVTSTEKSNSAVPYQYLPVEVLSGYR